MPAGPAPAPGEEGTVAVVRRHRPGSPPGRPGSAVPLALLAVGGAAVVALGYLVAVRMGLGQAVDDWLFEARKALRLGFRRRVVGGPVGFVGPLAVVAALGAVVVALRRRGPVVGVAVAACLLACAVTSTVLKPVLPRPILHDTIWAGDDNSYPSGHMAGAAAVTLAWVLVVAARWRPAVVAVGSAFTAAVAVATIGSGWHRPSDVAAGLALALAWMSIAALVAAGRGPEPGGSASGGSCRPRTG